MALYHESASILDTAQKGGGSLKSLIFGKNKWKSDPKTLFALTTEAAKWSGILAEVIEKSGILKLEKNITPTLALLLTHDLLLSKKGIALPATHGLNAALTRHKARLSAELTKVRLRQKFATLDALREHLNTGTVSDETDSSTNGNTPYRHPRWIRLNSIRSTLESELGTTFDGYSKAASLHDVTHAALSHRIFHVDEHVPNLIAIASPDDPTTFKAYKEGKLILQEKASCFPAYLLNPGVREGDVMDACAAPGNKTTHLAALLHPSKKRVIACEKDPDRSRTLQKMVKLAGAEGIVKIRSSQDFMRLDPKSKESAKITSLLLDPSCSGSGIIGRDEASITVRLPSAQAEDTSTAATRGKKRKRQSSQPKPQTSSIQPTVVANEAIAAEEVPDQEDDADRTKLQLRLENLSAFQLRLLKHAMHFSAARCITYSTCSVHAEENECVVVKALLSDVAVENGWRMMKRNEQVDGMRRWHRRGVESAVVQGLDHSEESDARKGEFDVAEVAESCIRCVKGGEDGTMGFFVAAFVRDVSTRPKEVITEAVESPSMEEEWDGFSSDNG